MILGPADHDIRCMDSASSSRLPRLIRNTVTREDMQCLKNDWLTDNVSIANRDKIRFDCWSIEY